MQPIRTQMRAETAAESAKTQLTIAHTPIISDHPISETESTMSLESCLSWNTLFCAWPSPPHCMARFTHMHSRCQTPPCATDSSSPCVGQAMLLLAVAQGQYHRADDHLRSRRHEVPRIWGRDPR